MPVWQGQGYNSGIRDATNLAWKLGLVVLGQASEAILDSYESERRAHAKAMIDLSVTAGRIFAPTNALVAWVRDKVAMGLNAIPPIKNYIVQMRFKPMPRFTRGIVLADRSGKPEGKATGRLFPQPFVTTMQGERCRLDDAVGLRFAVLSWGCDPQAHMSEESLRFWKGLGAELIAIVPPTQVTNFRGVIRSGTKLIGDADGTLHEWFAGQESDGSIVLMRPDRFVAGIVQPQQLDAATARLRAMMT
jgi:3-(3-hydroxy-phenyl)propionate hydroxylase